MFSIRMNDNNISLIISSTLPSPKQTIYDIYVNSGPSLILIIFVGIRWLISIIGFLFNFLLFWITIKDKSTLNSSCNYLIAIDALFTSIYQSSNSISMYIVLTGINFINLDICFYLMIYSIFSITMSLCSTFFIGFDRLISVIFPITFAKNKNSRIIIYFSIGISIIYSFYTLWSCMEICLSIPKTQVICSITDCFQKDLGQMTFRNNIIVILFSTLNYIIIWIVIKWRSTNNKQVENYTKKIFKSLSVIMAMVLAGWMLNTLVHVILPLFSLDEIQIFYLISILGCISNFVMACNLPVLYTFSIDYKTALNRFYNKKVSNGVPAKIEQNKLNNLEGTSNKNNKILPKEAW
ncbi:G_PROTEIN_RECEP_F1_2 domain-containing protein [Meloidogyne graminicola]|uniref:G_PROTEIN_RECEP_F1_2 domain-containing protein n=1 Tax=Meloidogyne graminicola TaxID=189291 RepID=A0A8S9ZDC7_9BILA|nr:G_PROTEIN_RECEP_F1_2 domain-containing protein [Meloidogyne graminicola]